MTLVVDASVAVKWVLDEPGSDEAEALLGHELIAPPLFRAECANVLWKAWRRNEIGEDEALIKLSQLVEDVGVVLRDAPADRALRFALRLRHAAYDCFYLALAEREATAFATADHKFADKVEAAGIAVPLLRVGPRQP